MPSDQINNVSLEYEKYDIPTLEENIEKFSLWKLLKTQILTPEFCVRYILDEDFASCDEDTYICVHNVLQYQKHITEEQLVDAFKKERELQIKVEKLNEK
jgi:hypothetical protein